MRIILVLFFIFLFLFNITTQVLAVFSFEVSQNSINEDQEIEANINLSLQNQGNKIYYLEGAFKKEGGTKYFGQTWNDSDWVGYTATNADKSLKSITTTPEGSWSGILKVKLDTTSSQLTDSGNYILKINRFTSSGSSPTSSDNEIIIAVTVNPTPLTNTPTPIPKKPTLIPNTPTLTPIPNTLIPTPIHSPTKTPTIKPSPNVTSSNPVNEETDSYNLPSSILGTSSTAPLPTISQNSVKNQNPESPLTKIVLIGGGIILLLAGGLFYTFLAKRRGNQI